MINCEKRIDPKPNDITQEIISISPSSGPELTEVTITGKNFKLSQYNLVLMGGYNIVPTSSTVTQLVFNVPSGLAAGDYTVALFVG